MTTRLLTRADILEADDRLYEEVDVPEWGGTVRVRSMEGVERDRFEATIAQISIDEHGKTRVDSRRDNVRALICSMTMVDDEGVNLFTPPDVLVLGHKSAAALERVFTVAQRLSGLTEADVEELKEQLGNAPAGASGSDSPVTSA
jgi:hypothetical protein